MSDFNRRVSIPKNLLKAFGKTEEVYICKIDGFDNLFIIKKPSNVSNEDKILDIRLLDDKGRFSWSRVKNKEVQIFLQGKDLYLEIN